MTVTADLAADDGLADRWAEATRGMVDLYVHALPDIIDRHGDDLDLATYLLEHGQAAALHRNHHSVTAERSELVRRVTGAPLYGAVLTNVACGGLEPAVVEVALRHGARWVGLPTLSAEYFRARMRSAGRLTDELAFGGRGLTLLDGAGDLHPEVVDIVDLTAAHRAVLNLGYCAPEECVVVARAAAAAGIRTVVLTNPLGVLGLSVPEAAELARATGAVVEVTSYSLHPLNPSARLAPSLAELIREVGVERCVLSSDGGLSVAPLPHLMVAAACARLGGFGFSVEELGLLLRDNPSTVLGL